MSSIHRKSVLLGVVFTALLFSGLWVGWQAWLSHNKPATSFSQAKDFIEIVIPDNELREELKTRLALRKIPLEDTQEGKGLRIHTQREEDIAFIKSFLGHQGYQHLLIDGVGNSRFESRLKYTIALERELERTLSMVDGVEQVKLHIAMTEPKLIGESEKRSASAFIVDSDPTKRPHIIRTVRAMIGDAIAELDSQRIEVVFAHQQPLSLDHELQMVQAAQINDPLFESKIIYETYYASKVKSLLGGLSLGSDSRVIVNVVLNDKAVVSKESVPLQGGEQGPVVMESFITNEASHEQTANVSSQKKRFMTGAREVTTNHTLRSVKRIDVAIVIQRHVPTHVVDSLTQLVRNAMGLDDQAVEGIVGRVDIVSLEQVQWTIPAIDAANNKTKETALSQPSPREKEPFAAQRQTEPLVESDFMISVVEESQE